MRLTGRGSSCDAWAEVNRATMEARALAIIGSQRHESAVDCLRIYILLYSQTLFIDASEDSSEILVNAIGWHGSAKFTKLSLTASA